MLTKLYCWLFGHRFWTKAYTNELTGTKHPITGELGHFYRHEKMPFCLRCESEAAPSSSSSKSTKEML